MDAFLQLDAEVCTYYETHSRDTSNAAAAFSDAFKKIIAGNEKSPVSALVLGCGNGSHDVIPLARAFLAERLGCPAIEITAVDRNSVMISALKTKLASESLDDAVKVSSQECNIDQANGFLDGKQFDVVVMFAVLQHTINWRHILIKVLGAMKPGAYLFVDEWFADPAESPLAVLDVPESATEGDWPYFFALREKYTGTFWDPEIKAHDTSAIVRFLGAYCSWKHEYNSPHPPTKANGSTSITSAVKEGRGFGPLAWGRGAAYTKFIAARPPNGLDLKIAKKSFGFKVHAFQKAGEKFGTQPGLWNADDALAVSMPVFESRMLKRFCVGVESLDRNSHEDASARIRQVQVLQLGLQFCCFSPHTLFAFPIQAQIDMGNAKSHATKTEPVRSMLIPEGEVGAGALVRLMTNLLVLKNRSVTSELLTVFDANPNLLPCSFRVTVGSTRPSVLKHQINGVTVVDVRLPKYSADEAQSTLRGIVASAITDSSSAFETHRFQTLKAMDLTAFRESFTSNEALTDKASVIDQHASAVKQFGDSLDCGGLEDGGVIARLFAALSPMIEEDEQLILVFSPCQFTVDETKKEIKRTSLGAIAVLEKMASESESMLAFRISRLELLNRALQTERYNAMHKISEGLRDRLDRLLKRIRISASDISFDAARALEPVSGNSKNALLERIRYIDERLKGTKLTDSDLNALPDELASAIRIALGEKPLTTGLETQSLRHLLLGQPQTKETTFAVAAKVNAWLKESFLNWGNAPDFVSHVNQLSSQFEPCEHGSVAWWPLLHEDDEILDFWKGYFEATIGQSDYAIQTTGDGPKLVPFFVYALQGLFAKDDVRQDRKLPKKLLLLIESSDLQSRLTLDWKAENAAKTWEYDARQQEKRGVEKLHGRLWFLNQIFHRADCTIVPQKNKKVQATVTLVHNKESS